MSKFLLDKMSTVSGPEIIFTMMYKNKKIEIYGEEHNSKLETNNIYTELIDHKDFTKKEVLVEHSTELCHLKDDEHSLFEIPIQTSGSELIFFESFKRKYSNVKCIDNRMELGHFTSIEEKFYQQFLDQWFQTKINQEIIDDFKTMILQFVEKIQLFINQKEYFSSHQEIYQQYLKILTIQLPIVIKISNMDLADLQNNDILNRQDVTNFQTGILMMSTLLSNIKRLGSIMVDINILNSIIKTRKRHILIFTGLNHAIRLYGSDLFDKSNNNIIISDTYKSLGKKYLNERLEDANPYPTGDEINEKIILSYFKI